MKTRTFCFEPRTRQKHVAPGVSLGLGSKINLSRGYGDRLRMFCRRIRGLNLNIYATPGLRLGLHAFAAFAAYKNPQNFITDILFSRGLHA